MIIILGSALHNPSSGMSQRSQRTDFVFVGPFGKNKLLFLMVMGNTTWNWNTKVSSTFH
jgi:hypothetical protein